MKKVLAIFSPKFIDFGPIFKADGAMTSWSSRFADSYIFSGKTSKIEALVSPVLDVFLFPNNFLKNSCIMILQARQDLTQFALGLA